MKPLSPKIERAIILHLLSHNEASGASPPGISARRSSWPLNTFARARRISTARNFLDLVEWTSTPPSSLSSRSIFLRARVSEIRGPAPINVSASGRYFRLVATPDLLIKSAFWAFSSGRQARQGVARTIGCGVEKGSPVKTECGRNHKSGRD